MDDKKDIFVLLGRIPKIKEKYVLINEKEEIYISALRYGKLDSDYEWAIACVPYEEYLMNPID